MESLQTRQFALLLLGVGMVLVGGLGYVGALTLRTLLVGVSFLLVALLSFFVGVNFGVPRRA